ncbi:MAG: ABC transporter substrate-binding protein [Alphaproteobacteria bacterium]|nr:ABC transporter substrate-binding protein [Alphaproteobacteria bacterium]
MIRSTIVMNRVGAVLLAGLGLGASSAMAQDTLNVLIANERSNTFYGMFLAEELGYWEDVGIKVNWLSSATTIPYVAFLSNGQADLVMFDAAQTLQAVDAGQDFKIIYEDMQFAPEAMYVAADSDITEIAQLKGQTIGLVSDRDRIIAQVALESAGLTIDDVDTVVLGEGGPTLANAFIRGTVAAVAGGATELATIQGAGVAIRNITPPEVAENPANSFAIRTDRIDELRNPVERFLLAWSKGMEAGRLDLQMSGAIMSEAVPEQWVTLEAGRQHLELAAMKLHEPLSDQRGALHPDMWARVQPVLVSVGEISKTHDPATFTDSSFIEAANQYNMDEIKADVAEWIANNQDRYNAMAQ